MARRRKKNKKPGRAGRIALGLFAALLLALVAAAGVGALNANVVRTRRAEVVITNLPPRFDGVTLLYASDIDLCGTNTPRKAGALFAQLQSLEPDILILGGDYNSSSLLEVLNRPEDGADDTQKKLRERADFFNRIASFEAPLGKFAIASPEDPDWEGLRRLVEECGFRPLINDRAAVTSGGDTLWLVGICQQSTGLNSAGGAFSRDDCVIVTAYSPSLLPVLLTSEAGDGGQWSDLTLCGHTHGGQVTLFGRSALELDHQERRYLTGWSVDSGHPILVTEGVGCEGANLRLGSAPEVWLITLRRP